mgnify:CR=1 FL=1
MVISVIIPLYNAENTILAALESVRIQRNVTAVFEIIVINDGSTDRSAQVVKDYISHHPEMNILLISQPQNKGVSAARNAGLKRSSGDFIAFLDADDEWLPEKTEFQLNCLFDHEVDFISCRRNNSVLKFPYAVENGWARITFRKQMLRNEAQPSTVLFKRKILTNTGFFDENQRYAEDVQYWLRISRKNKMYILDKNLVLAGGGKRTFGVSGLSADLYQMHRGYCKNLEDMYRFGWISLSGFIFYLLLTLFNTL